MRHDAHFVEELTRRSGRHIGSMIPLDFIEPNAEQPRTSLGNIEELAASIREKGVLEPILVRSIGPNRYQIVSGERRYRAAMLAGLEEIPAIDTTGRPIQRPNVTVPRAAAQPNGHRFAGRNARDDDRNDVVDEERLPRQLESRGGEQRGEGQVEHPTPPIRRAAAARAARSRSPLFRPAIS